MADPKIVNEWLEKADEDFHFADKNLAEGSNFYAQICFHFHQAAEKYLKAFIVAHDLEFEKVHNLIALLKTGIKKSLLFRLSLQSASLSILPISIPGIPFTGRLTTQKKKHQEQKTQLKR